MDKERRNLPRKYLIVYSRVFDRNTGNLLGYLSDLSLKGAMIISELSLQQNSVLPLRFEQPDMDTGEFEIEHMDIAARVVYSQPDVSPTFFNIGFEFLDVDQKQTIFIKKMMEKYEFKRQVSTYSTPPSMLEDK